MNKDICYTIDIYHISMNTTDIYPQPDSEPSYPLGYPFAGPAERRNEGNQSAGHP